MTPRSGHSLFDQNKSHNTWNGPIVGPVDGRYHIFAPLYINATGIKSLFRVMYIMHGTAAAITGPYTWFREPSLPGGINPAFLTYNDSATGKAVYSLWDGPIRIADSPAMHNFTDLPGHGGCGGNPVRGADGADGAGDAALRPPPNGWGEGLASGWMDKSGLKFNAAAAAAFGRPPPR